MTDLLLHGKPVGTVFDLLGDKEDDITYSLGWALAQSERLVAAMLATAYGEDIDAGALTALRLQETVAGAGRTDVEVQTERVHLILEAKRGWWLPTESQLRRYAGRFETGRAPRCWSSPSAPMTMRDRGYQPPLMACPFFTPRGRTSLDSSSRSPNRRNRLPRSGCCASSCVT
jgi:hypothetical protein